MANDRHGKHNKPTIAFRVTPYEQQVINERVKASGIFCAWLIYSDTNFSRSITYVIGREAACVEEHLWMVGEALDDDEFSDYLSEYLMALIVEVANATRDQIIDNFMRFMTGGSEDGAGDM